MLKLVYRALLYLLPIGMGNMEMQINEVAGKAHEASLLLAPTVAAASIGLFLPLVRTSETAPAGFKKNVDAGATGFALIGLAFGLFVWHTLVATNLGAVTGAWMNGIHLWTLGPRDTIAILVYTVAAVLSETKLLVEK